MATDTVMIDSQDFLAALQPTLSEYEKEGSLEVMLPPAHTRRLRELRQGRQQRLTLTVADAILTHLDRVDLFHVEPLSRYYEQEGEEQWTILV